LKLYQIQFNKLQSKELDSKPIVVITVTE